MYPSYIYYTIGSYSWRITVETGNLIRITIDNCILKRDSQIRIYDGYDSASGVLINIETDSIPTETILSSTNVLLLEFEINTFSESKFKLLWSKVPKTESSDAANATNSLNCTTNSVITVGKADVMKLNSPGWPTGYASAVTCKWTFLPSEMGYHVSLSFISIDLENTPDCLADNVRVGIGSNMQQFNQSVRMCSASFVSRRNRFHGTPNLQVTFETDFTNNRTGFESMVMLDCGGVLEQQNGELNNNMTTRPTNASQVWLNDTCTWLINVRRGRTIQFAFASLDLSKNSDGSCNSYILIRNGAHEDSPFLGNGKFCGSLSEVNSLPKTASNKAMVQYVRGRMLQKKQFVLRWKQIEHDCGGSLILDYDTNSTIIKTPNFPSIPPAHIECVWRITSPNSELLKIEFLDRFDLTNSPNCESEYLEVRDGSTSSAQVIGKYCAEMPQPIYTTTNMARLFFYTDVSVPKNGFKLKVSIARCGKSIVANKGFLTSQGYPGKGSMRIFTN